MRPAGKAPPPQWGGASWRVTVSLSPGFFAQLNLGLKQTTMCVEPAET